VVADPEFAEIWDEVDRRWMPSTAELTADGEEGELARMAYLVQVAADGLWVHDHVHRTLTMGQREALTSTLLGLIP
jgi:hypothetical protein